MPGNTTAGEVTRMGSRLQASCGNLAVPRDASEGLIRRRLLELELKLLQAENELISNRLGGWIERILRTAV